jgi:hypothetical protein
VEENPYFFNAVAGAARVKIGVDVGGTTLIVDF